MHLARYAIATLLLAPAVKHTGKERHPHKFDHEVKGPAALNATRYSLSLLDATQIIDDQSNPNFHNGFGIAG